jgi:hypothetical protein
VNNADNDSGDRPVSAFDLYGTLVDPIAIVAELGQVLGDAGGRREDGFGGAAAVLLRLFWSSLRLAAYGGVALPSGPPA